MEHVLRGMEGVPGWTLHREVTGSSVYAQQPPRGGEDGEEGKRGWLRCLEKTGGLKDRVIRRESWGKLSVKTSQLYKSNSQNKKNPEEQGERTVTGAECGGWGWGLQFR